MNIELTHDDLRERERGVEDYGTKRDYSEHLERLKDCKEPQAKCQRSLHMPCPFLFLLPPPHVKEIMCYKSAEQGTRPK